MQKLLLIQARDGWDKREICQCQSEVQLEKTSALAEMRSISLIAGKLQVVESVSWLKNLEGEKKDLCKTVFFIIHY